MLKTHRCFQLQQQQKKKKETQWEANLLFNSDLFSVKTEDIFFVGKIFLWVVQDYFKEMSLIVLFIYGYTKCFYFYLLIRKK